MLETLGDLIGTVATGGAVGLLGTGLSFVTNYFEKKQAHAQEVELRRLDMDLAKVEAAGLERAAQVEAEGQKEVAAYDALQASYREAMQRWSSGDSKWLILVDVVRGLTRPGGAWVLLAIVAVVWFTLGSEDEDLRGRIMHSLLFLTEAAWLWWYGARKIGQAH